MNTILDNQIFLIALDLDGTLLTSEKTISPLTKSILQMLASMGNVITVASGRASRSIVEIYETLGIRGPFIGYNGSLIDNPFDQSFVPFRRMMKKEVLLDFISHFGEDAFANIVIEDGYDQYYLRKNEKYVNFFHPEGMNLHYGSILKNLDRDVMTCVIEVKDIHQKQEMTEYVNLHVENMSIRWWFNSNTFGEFYFYDTNKMTSIYRLASYYHIDRAHIIAFGDAPNDLQMIKGAGISFAMKNGAPQLKEAATYVTEYDNDHDGIYYALKKFFQL